MRPRRGRCRECARTHVLLPDLCLLRRRDGVAVIGAAIEAKVSGLGHRRIAAGLGVPKDTVRGWLRRFEAGAERIRAHFTAFADALGAIGVAGRAWVLRLGATGVWPLVATLSGGVLLCNTSSPFPVVR